MQSVTLYREKKLTIETAFQGAHMLDLDKDFKLQSIFKLYNYKYV